MLDRLEVMEKICSAKVREVYAGHVECLDRGWSHKASGTPDLERQGQPIKETCKINVRKDKVKTNSI